MGAYDKNGRLIRAAPRDSSDSENSGGKQGEGEEQTPDSAEEDYTHPLREEKRQAAEGKTKSKDDVPPETMEDLRPFPLNKEFRSQSVLSEELRDVIYERVTKLGLSVRVVSAELGITMERVAAVVRLKQLELDWLQQVRGPLSSAIPQSRPNPNDETHKIRLVLKTNYMVTQLALPI